MAKETAETPRIDPSIIHEAKLGIGVLRSQLQRMSEGKNEDEDAFSEALWLTARVSSIIDEALANAEAAA